MQYKMDDIIEINTALNAIVQKRKNTNAQIVNYTNQIIDLEKNLASSTNTEPIKAELQQQINALQVLVQTCHVNNASNVYDMDAHTTTEQNEKMQLLTSAFVPDLKLLDALANPVQISLEDVEYIKCMHKGIAINTKAGNKIVIYPNITLAQNAQNNFYIVPTSDLKISFDNNNPQNDVTNTTQANASQNKVHILIDTIFDETFSIDSSDSYNKLQSAYTDYINLLQNINGPALVGIKKTFFDNIVAFGNSFSEFIKQLQSNTEILQLVSNSQILKDVKNADAAKTLQTMALVDLLKCFNTLADIQDASSNESFSMLYMVALQQGTSITNYQDVVLLNNNTVKDYFKQLQEAASNELAQNKNVNSPYFNVANMLVQYNKDLHTAYLSHLYKYASIVIKADGKVTRQEEDLLGNLFSQKIGSTSQTIAVTNKVQEPEKTLEQLIYELYDLTGLNEVKAEISTLISLIKIQKARENFDLKNTKMSLHLVLTGNPGTGKTTVARFIGKIYKNLGVLQQGHLIETDRSGMIAEYTGQTAIKVNKLVDSALHGVLFIDEAYAIMLDQQDVYGKEAIATLLKRMEDDRDKLIVILAGYTNEMKQFIDTNPGLQSRFNKYIHFSDFTADELYSIFIGMSRKLHFTFSTQVIELIKNHFQAMIDLGDTNFGNGRYVRNFFEKMIEKQAKRLAMDTELNKEKLTTFLPQDLPDII